MAEQFFWRILVLIITTFASPSAFSASYYLQMRELSSFLADNEMIAMMGIEHFLMGVSNVPLILASAWRGNTIWFALLLFTLVLLLVVGYGGIINRRGTLWLESRRLHKSMAAMEIIFAFILAFASYTMLFESMRANIYSSIIIFLLSFGVMMKFGKRVPLFIYFLLATVIAYFLV